MPKSFLATKKSAATVHDGNNEVSNDDFNTMVDKKLNKFKSSITSELIENISQNFKILYKSIRTS